ncbi:hypothetical protein C8R45DRAFT_995488 [Mycena sanguinolenta]|nr:hypothetical protein C8R45DRAFT_995488 [Mycena sanguinolenta]
METFIYNHPPKVAARTLGYALIHAPSPAGRDCISQEIVGCNDEPEYLAGLAHLYIYGLIRIFRNPKGPTPLLTADQSPDPRFGTVSTLNRTTLPPTSLKTQLLFRDRYRCTLSDAVDRGSLDDALTNPGSNPDVEDFVQAFTSRSLRGSKIQTLQVAHIISQSLTNSIEGLSVGARAKFNWASSAAAILDRFSGIDVKKLLGGTNLHSAVNAVMATHEGHELLDCLLLCLVPNPDPNAGPNAYLIKQFSQIPNENLQDSVVFQERRFSNGHTISPPSPVLLALHAACAHIAHMSGAAEILEEFDRDIPPSAGLALGFTSMDPNPVAAHDLSHALHRLSVVRPVFIPL